MNPAGVTERWRFRMLNPENYSPGFYKIFNELTEIERKYGSEIIRALAAKLILKFIWFRWSDLKAELINELNKKVNGDKNGNTKSPAN